MKYRLMDILACPICKDFPLDLIVFSEREVNRTIDQKKPFCELYCAYKKTDVKNVPNPPCEECIRKEIVEGVLYCKKCGRWYPISDEIPRMLPDKLRNRNEDLEFLRKNKEHLPDYITNKGLPFNLTEKTN
ncbi:MULTISPECIES: Trm112 family protein [Acidianus]|uniref:Trm112 family protein n=1 Tax=Candidatus Acidianus copahuensis TaxID=1160895 RepID=A0A031LN21_9CREN|nr:MULTISPECIES: Trm112 family protein [Acidianus]EZQ03825.1 hypothetical protein CM19_08860 [Candidatus Acidianus copahuensis]NON62694.1 Trm112 family protein [Acidianus sp. RZ1]